MNELKIQSHLTDEELLQLSSGAGTEEEMDRWLEHTAQCDLCAQRMAQLFEKGPLMEVTPLFEDEVRHRIETTAERRMRVERTPESTPGIFRSYPFKVALAACATLVMMNLGAFSDVKVSEIAEDVHWPVERITEELRDVTRGVDLL